MAGQLSSVSKFIHFHDGRWWIYQELPEGRFLTPEKRSPFSKIEPDSYFAYEPLLDIAYSYTGRQLAIARAKRLNEDGMFINN